jgi:putative CocE/NonD family hydrolase
MKNQNNVYSILKVTLVFLTLIFITIGCEKEQNESSELTELTEQNQTLNEVAFSEVEDEELGVIIERNVPVPMRDGTILRADIHRPDSGGPYPVLVQRTPYGKDGNFDRFVKAGYIVVSQDARGRYESEGEYESMWRFETHDAVDGYDTVEWAAKLPGSTGKVGTFGTSYPAFLQWRLAPLHPPSLVAMSAFSIPAQIWYGEAYSLRPGFRLQWWASMAADMRRRKSLPGVHTEWEANKLWDAYESEKWINWLPWLELPDDFFGHETKYVKDWLKDPHRDPWKLQEGCKNVTVPNFNVVGWYDHANGDMLLFRTMVREAKTEVARKGSRIIIGPWTHGSYRRRYGNIDFGPDAVLDRAIQIRWFAYWFKGKQNGVDKDPPVRIFVMGDNKWRDEQHWPLQRAREKILFITSNGHANTPKGDGKLVDELPQFSKSDRYSYDPNNPVPTPTGARRPIPADQRPLADRQDILVYKTEPLAERIEVTGNPVVELYASSSAPDTDWFARLIDVYPDGLALDVSHGLIRARYRNGMDKSELINPGEVIKYTIRMRPTSNAFLLGHRIRLDITSSDFPNYDRNHNTAADQNANATLVVANQTIYNGGEQATRIILPWVPNSPEKEKLLEEEKTGLAEEKQISPLYQAAADGDIKQLEVLISRGVDVNVKDEQGMSPLDYAVEAGKKEMVELLIQASADVNLGPWTALHSAARTGHKDIAELLIQAGADVNLGPWTALHSAAGAGHKDIAELLIQAGADVNAKTEAGRTPLHQATRSNRPEVEMIELLIAKGANVNASDNAGVSPLYYTFSANKIDIAKLLVAKSTDMKDNHGLTALHVSAVEGRRDFAEFLVAEGVDVDERDDNYEFTPLHYAARFGSTKVAEVLIAHGADIKAKDKWDYQPIHWAAYHDRSDMIELLINKGVDVNARTSLGQTPLELAIPRRNTAAIKVLQKHGAKE